MEKPEEPEISQQSTPENLEQKAEAELSPEVIEKIMDKVEDINSKGLAYSVLSRSGTGEDELSIILQDGLSRKGYAVHTPIYFNIVGRAYDVEGESELGESEISGSHWVRRQDKVVVLFDSNDFEETHPNEADDPEKWEQVIMGKYTVDLMICNMPDGRRDIHSITDGVVVDKSKSNFKELRKRGYIDENGRFKPSTDFGFKLFGEVAPSQFRGIVVNGHIDFYTTIKEIQKSGLFLPVYDGNGNLLWPKQMSYEEVKKFVEERDKKE